MTDMNRIEGSAVPLPIENLDTDQIMPKQFLRIIDKAGLNKGLLYDLRSMNTANRSQIAYLTNPLITARAS